MDAPLNAVAWETVPWKEMAKETMRKMLIHNYPRPASTADCLNVLEQMR